MSPLNNPHAEHDVMCGIAAFSILLAASRYDRTVALLHALGSERVLTYTSKLAKQAARIKAFSVKDHRLDPVLLKNNRSWFTATVDMWAHILPGAARLDISFSQELIESNFIFFLEWWSTVARDEDLGEQVAPLAFAL